MNEHFARLDTGLLSAASTTVVVSAANMSSSIALVTTRRQLSLCPAACLIRDGRLARDSGIGCERQPGQEYGMAPEGVPGG